VALCIDPCSYCSSPPYLGDFTKTVAVPPIIKTMARRLGISAGKKTERTTWTRHIEKTITDGGLDPTGMVDTINRSFKDLIFKAAITEDIVAARKTYNNGTSIPPASLGFVRERLQVCALLWERSFANVL
jgi:hypothetical protein